MRIYIVIPAHNEEAYISSMLDSLVTQSVLPTKVVVVNDNSTDKTQSIIDTFSSEYPFITSISISSEAKNVPGSKVINAFSEGYKLLDDDYDLICKFDADLIFPKHYLENIISTFSTDPECGMAGGFCYIANDDTWILENLTNTDHLRGALKAYRKECFKDIGGLKNSIGWDTVDELLAQFHGWKIKTDPSLHVKHLKPTGASYTKASKFLQGEAFYKMRYGLLLTSIASLKQAFRKKKFKEFLFALQGYFQAKSSNKAFIVSEEEGKFIRKHRWKGIKNKLT
ncbi:glycosyltransferase [Ulvibacter antarcticus]|uniref:Glycosyl transferase family 2 n=1 Tax=Ulvibacter antarcticus TaxID=442714 RepID=A0A3L9Y8W3_9FLAO|nr:glycosyltransferase family A protein [Ulvibacter antarcticus]RMA57131.1 glycosyl transferase family 2 [Ulvibacter antarcticus]